MTHMLADKQNICITPCYIRIYTIENKNHKTYLNKLYTGKSPGNFKCV